MIKKIKPQILSRIIMYPLLIIVSLIGYFVLVTAGNGIDYLYTIYDRQDTTQHIQIAFTQDSIDYSVCDTIKTPIEVNNITEDVIPIFVSYAANRINENGYQDASDNSPDDNVSFQFNTTKKGKDEHGIGQSPGKIKYETTAFIPIQTCLWEPGTYEVRISYTYTYKVTLRGPFTDSIIVEVAK